jgi:hypothetical protein
VATRGTASGGELRAVAAAREETPHLLKMLLTCRSMVRSLTNSWRAMALLVIPLATRRSTLDLAPAQAVQRHPGRRWTERLHPPEVRPRAQLAVDRTSGVELELTAFLVAEPAAGQTDEHAHPAIR